MLPTLEGNISVLILAAAAVAIATPAAIAIATPVVGKQSIVGQSCRDYYTKHCD